MQFVQANDKQLEYFEQGSGDAVVVLIHGAGSSALIWDTVQQRLADAGFRSIAISLPGAGGSDRPDDLDEYNPAAYARCIRAALDSLALKRFSIVGHSLGVSNVLGFAAENADGLDIQAMILMAGGNPIGREAPGPERAEDIKRAWKAPDPTTESERRAEWEALHQGLAPLIRDRLWKDIQNNPMEREVGQRLGARKDLSAFAEQTDIPTLIISGDQDSVVPLDFTLALYPTFKKEVRHCHVIHGVDHYPNAEAPDEVSDVYIRFFRQVT
jgi:pimeloyl-ACP methyl ester carboxylesterase